MFCRSCTASNIKRARVGEANLSPSPNPSPNPTKCVVIGPDTPFMWGANVAGNQVTLEAVQEALNNPAAEQLPVSTQVSNLVASLAGECVMRLF